MILELNQKEKEILDKVLHHFEEELKGEIVKTDAKDFRKYLHAEEDVVRDLLKKVA